MKKIEIKGSIVSNDDAWIYELFEIEHTSPKKVNDIINEIEENEDVVVEINSGGGSVFAGSEIYTSIRKINPKVEIVGLAGSAASFIAMASDDVSISPTAQIMIHRASSIQLGNKHDMDDMSEMLNSIDSSIAYAYKNKTKLNQEELLQMMSKETWFTAEQAKEKGFVDSIMFEERDAVASVGLTLPPTVINKVRNIIKQPINESKFSDEERKEIRDIAKDEIEKDKNKKDDDDKKDNKTNKIRRWV